MKVKRQRRILADALGMADYMFALLAEHGLPECYMPGRDAMLQLVVPEALRLDRARRRAAAGKHGTAAGRLDREKAACAGRLDCFAAWLAGVLVPSLPARLAGTVEFRLPEWRTPLVPVAERPARIRAAA
jgi:hypothetical protein